MKKSTKNLLITVLIAVVCCSCLGWLTAGFQNFDVAQRFEKERNSENLITLTAVSLDTTRHSSGVDITVDENGVVTLDGKPSADVDLTYATVSLQPGEYILSGDGEGSASTCYLSIVVDVETIYGNLDGTFTVTTAGTYTVQIHMEEEAELNNVKLYPVINSGDTAVKFYK